jgi:hypothetical protein
MSNYRTILGIRVVEWHEVEDFLLDIERSKRRTGRSDGSPREPTALEVPELHRAVPSQKSAVTAVTSLHRQATV